MRGVSPGCSAVQQCLQHTGWHSASTAVTATSLLPTGTCLWAWSRAWFKNHLSGRGPHAQLCSHSIRPHLLLEQGVPHTLGTLGTVSLVKHSAGCLATEHRGCGCWGDAGHKGSC